MKYRLEHIDKLATVILNGVQNNEFVISAEDCANFLHEALQQRDFICESLVKEVFKFSREKEIELYINSYQTALTNLLDRLYRQQQKINSPTPSMIEFYRSFGESILYILGFIEERFSKYFDRDDKVPEIYLQLTIQEMKVKLNLLHELKFPTETDSIALPKVLKTLTSFTEDRTEKNITYRDIMFRKELIRELEQYSSWSPMRDLYSAIDQLLIYLNYNDKEYVNSLVNRFVQDLATYADVNDRIDRLLLCSKSLHQLQAKPDSALHIRHPSLKNQLSNWFSEELYYLERKLGLMSLSKQPSTHSPVTEAKVFCHVSVDQLSIFFRAATDIKVISAPSQRALFDKIAPYISTTYRKTISADSMRSKSYNPENKDIEAMKDILMQLYKKLTQY